MAPRPAQTTHCTAPTSLTEPPARRPRTGSPEHYAKISTTRTYEDRLNTLAAVREAGISVCCGGILGLGEDAADRVGLLQTLASLPEHPESVPINALVPIKGTPLGDSTPVSALELVRCIAAARVVMPRSVVRLSAGRVAFSGARGRSHQDGGGMPDSRLDASPPQLCSAAGS